MKVFEKSTELYHQIKNADSVKCEILLPTGKIPIQWKVNFLNYNPPSEMEINPLTIFDSCKIKLPCKIANEILKSDLDVLSHFTTCDSQKSQLSNDRLEWYFYIDWFLDSECISEQKNLAECVHDLSIFLNNPSHKSKIEWVNNANSLLKYVLQKSNYAKYQIESIIEEITSYYNSLLIEKSKMNFSKYISNRIGSTGSASELECCFGYKNVALSHSEKMHIALFKNLFGQCQILHNDTLSAGKEFYEQNGARIFDYFSNHDSFSNFVQESYSRLIDTFISLQSQEHENLYWYWQSVQNWICGSLIWHLNSGRYSNYVQNILPRSDTKLSANGRFSSLEGQSNYKLSH